MIAQQCYPSEEPGTGPTTCSPPGGLVGAGATGAGATGDLAIEKKTGAGAEPKQETKQYQEQEQKEEQEKSFFQKNKKKTLPS